MQFTPRQSHKYRRYSRAGWLKLKRILSNRATWLLLAIVLIVTWWFNGGSEELSAVKFGAAGFGKDLFKDGVTQGLQFFPPSNPRIHVRFPRRPAQTYTEYSSTLADGHRRQISCERTVLFQVETY